MTPEVSIVQEWHAALNSGDVEELAALVQQDVEVGGPRGATRGAQVVREWFGRANVQLKPARFFNREDIVVVEQMGEWLSEDTGQVTGSQLVATVFVVRDGLISRIIRYDDLKSALNEAGLDESCVVKPS